jgi:hypothetical protein
MVKLKTHLFPIHEVFYRLVKFSWYICIFNYHVGWIFACEFPPISTRRPLKTEINNILDQNTLDVLVLG